MKPAREDERTTGAAHRYTIYYQSSRTFSLTGVFFILWIPDAGLTPGIRQPAMDHLIDTL